MTREFCEESDLLTQTNQAVLASDVRRMEWQANYFASCLLMPRQNVYTDARSLMQGLQLRDKGFGTLYVDSQACNLQNYSQVTGVLMKKYEVSRAAITFRLEELGLLVDGRSSEGLQPIGAHLQLPL
jgi:Zn-dependent peptidase ImmA (M78 family)